MNTKIDRIVAFYIDYMIIIAISSIGIFISTINFKIGIISYLLLAFVGVICKDLIFKNKSIMKKALRLQVLTLDDMIPSVWQLCFRNITLFIWPIDVILVMACNKRLGDIICHTKVVKEY